MITQEKLKELFNYKDGKLFWKVKKSARTYIGDEAGSKNKSTGYLNIFIDSKSYKAHRLIFLFHHGFLPKYLDHIDGNRMNNKIENLRECTAAQNQWNQKTSTRNTSGIKGVEWCEDKKLWRGVVTVAGNRCHLGYFKNSELARKAVYEFRELRHGEFANHG